MKITDSQVREIGKEYDYGWYEMAEKLIEMQELVDSLTEQNTQLEKELQEAAQ